MARRPPASAQQKAIPPADELADALAGCWLNAELPARFEIPRAKVRVVRVGQIVGGKHGAILWREAGAFKL